MSSRALILEKATELLAASFDGDISTRAVCEAAGVGQPILYRNFGDKDGLIAAVVDGIWSTHLAQPVASSDDPVADLRRWWDAHTAFALENHNAYRLLFGARLTKAPTALTEATARLTEVLERCADIGRLRVSPEAATRIVLSANSGLALGLILRTTRLADSTVSAETREAVLRGILLDGPSGDAQVDAVITLRARLAETYAFTPGELLLLREWLTRLQSD